MQTRYDLNLVISSLERQSVHPEISDSNLGDNVHYLLEHVGDPVDLGRIGEALEKLPSTIGSLDLDDKHFEIGHYVQAIHGFEQIQAGSYGVISCITPRMRGLFWVGEGQMVESPFDPDDIRVIFGTYII